MGIISSKLLKHDSKPSTVSAAVQTESPEKTTQIPDVRSPTAEIVRTPIIIEKLRLEEGAEYRSLPLRNKLLKSLKLDPRSPTIGIYRTPILIEETPSSKTTPNTYDSPVSIYSSNINDSPLDDVMTPIEPSVNVSGFEFPKEIYYGEYDVTIGNEEEVKENENENKSSLKVLDQPNTYEAKKLLEEIMSDEENFIRKVKMSAKKSKKFAKNTSETKGKIRPPLSNITSSTNSPGNISVGKKIYNKNKVVPEFGPENSSSPNVKHMVQWDQNNTVYI